SATSERLPRLQNPATHCRPVWAQFFSAKHLLRPTSASEKQLWTRICAALRERKSGVSRSSYHLNLQSCRQESRRERNTFRPNRASCAHANRRALTKREKNSRTNLNDSALT